MKAFLSNNRTWRYLVLFVLLVVAVATRGSGVSAAPTTSPATSITFTVGHYECWGNGTFEFYIGNTKVGETAGNGQCDCYGTPVSFTTSDPAAMALIEAPQCTIYKVVRAGAVQIGYVDVDVTREDGNEHVSVFDRTPQYDNGNICYGQYFDNADLSGGKTGSQVTCDGPTADTDGDGISNNNDNCPAIANPDQADSNQDGHGNACEVKSVVFEMQQSHNSGDTLRFFIGGVEVANRPSTSDGWVNYANVIQAVPDQYLSLVSGDPSCIEFKVTRDQYYDYIPYVRVKVSTWSGGTQTVCIADFLGNAGAAGGNCEDRWGYDGYSYGSNSGIDTDAGNTDQNVFLSGPGDTDGDGANNCVDPDIDGDNIANAVDNCPVVSNSTQTDTNADGTGDACEATLAAVPWQGLESRPHVVYSGGSLMLQAVASQPDGTKLSLASGTWDAGDGSGPQTIDVSNSRVLELQHTYTGADYTPYTATVSVTTSAGKVYTDTMKVQIVPKSLDAEVNMAIDKALWFEHKRMKLTGDKGSWNDDNSVASTASTVQAFQVNGHRESGDASRNPYVSDVARGLKYLQSRIRRVNISAQTAGNPDVNGNGYGLETDEGHVTYTGGQIVDAFVASGTPNKVATSGPEAGRTYKAIVQDLIDTYSWGQDENHGGWVYDWNANDGIDSSSSGWWGVAAHAAEVWGVTVPAWVKSENLTKGIYGTLQQYNGSNTDRDGSCGYRNTNDWNTYAETAACMIMMSTDGVARADVRYQAAEKYLERQWNGNGEYNGKGNIYGMYNLAKAMRTAPGTPITLLGGSIDWYGADVDSNNADANGNGYARYLVGHTNQDGSTNVGGWVNGGGTTSTAWMILILSPALFEQGPTAVCSVDATTVCQAGAAGGCNTTGSNPYATVHLDGGQSIAGDNAIAGYSWNFQNGGSTIDSTNVTAEASFSSVGTYGIQLTVTDTKGNSSSVTCPVAVTSAALAPIADAGGPYTMCIGQPSLILDASGSTGRGSNIVSYEWDFKGAVNFSAIDATGSTTDQGAYFGSLGRGTYDVGVRVRDDNDPVNAVVAYSTVTVKDCTPPVITVPANISVTTADPTAAVTYTVSATDNVDPNVNLVCKSSPTTGLSSGDQFPQGTTTITCNAKDQDNNIAETKTFTITVADTRPTTTVVTCTPTVTYNGQAQEVCSATATSGDGLNVTVPVTYTSNVNVGVVTGSASYAGDASHTGSSGSATFAITPRAATVTADSGTKVFGSADPTLGASSTGFIAADNITASFTGRDGGESVGTYATHATASGAALSNYSVSYNDGALTITKANSTATATGGSFTYDGNSHAGACSFAGVNGDVLNGTLTYSSGAAPVAAGNYTVTCDFAGNGTYNASTASATITIAKTAAVCSVTGYTVTYDTAAHTAIGSCTGVNGATLAGLNLAASTHTNAGTYNDAWTFTDVTGNYNNTSGSVIDVIKKAPTKTTLAISTAVAAAGAPVTLTATVTSVLPGAGTPNGTVTFMEGATVIGTATLNASGVATLTTTTLSNGPHSITATYSESQNFLSSSSNAVSTLIYSYPVGGGTFVIADKVATMGATVNFWGSQWEKNNIPSGGASNASFKGFAISPNAPTVGATFTAAPGNSAPSPAAVPEYIGIIVTSKVTKSGSNITGTIVKLVVVKVAPGYAGNPGNAGNGTIVAFIQ